MLGAWYVWSDEDARGHMEHIERVVLTLPLGQSAHFPYDKATNV